jgi:hypothetical protein
MLILSLFHNTIFFCLSFFLKYFSFHKFVNPKSDMVLQVLKNQQGRKHKRPISSSGQANSSGTMNTTGPIPSLASSNPFTNTVPMPLMHHNASHLAVLGADAAGARE